MSSHQYFRKHSPQHFQNSALWKEQQNSTYTLKMADDDLFLNPLSVPHTGKMYSITTIKVIECNNKKKMMKSHKNIHTVKHIAPEKKKITQLSDCQTVWTPWTLGHFLTHSVTHPITGSMCHIDIDLNNVCISSTLL